MLRNYLKIAFRNLWKHKGFSAINILGLTVGLAAFFLIFLYVQFELHYDAFNTKADRIYRVVTNLKTPSEMVKTDGPAWAVPPHALREFPAIESMVRIANQSFVVRKGTQSFEEPAGAVADSSLFRIFDFKLLQGDPVSALREPNTVVLSERAAKKYFGVENPMGKQLFLVDQKIPITVTGVMRNIPENSMVQGDMFVSLVTILKFFPTMEDEWGNYGSQAYFLLKPGASAARLQNAFPAFLERLDGAEMKQMQMFPTILLEPLRDVHLRSSRDEDRGYNITKVYIFAIIGIFVVLIASINFVNLTTARSIERAKEVGIRKVVGALRAQLAGQFIGESVILCIISFFLSIGLAAALLRLFNQLSGKMVSGGIFEHPAYLLALFGIAVAIGLLAGLYPALVLSSFRPVTVLKGRFSSTTKGIWLRKGLVIGQFTISIILIIGTLVVYSQMHFMRTQELGFNKDQKIILNTHGDSARTVLRDAVGALPNVISVSLTGGVPGFENPGAYTLIQNKKGDMQPANMALYFVDFDYIPQYQIKLVAGRPFSKNFMTDTTQSIILNESAVKAFGYASPQDIVGKRFSQWGREGNVIGVMKDFHFETLQLPILPLSMRIEPNGCNLLSINIRSQHIPETISAIESKWKEIIPSRPFSFQFLDDKFNEHYRDEDRFGRLFLNFAILAIFISCLGLLGLAAYSTRQRTKEIGVRKVMGASVGSIVQLLSTQFMVLVLISFVIAAPIAWIFMHKWLQSFAYRTSIGWAIFVTAGFAAMAIALITISFQAIRAALMNPVVTLRTE